MEDRILIASEGKEYFNIYDEEVHGKTIHLGINDSPENWEERDEKIEEDL
jgi:hypothetical protein